jgi:hypothetical protein
MTLIKKDLNGSNVYIYPLYSIMLGNLISLSAVQINPATLLTLEYTPAAYSFDVMGHIVKTAVTHIRPIEVTIEFDSTAITGRQLWLLNYFWEQRTLLKVIDGYFNTWNYDDVSKLYYLTAQGNPSDPNDGSKYPIMNGYIKTLSSTLVSGTKHAGEGLVTIAIDTLVAWSKADVKTTDTWEEGE